MFSKPYKKRHLCEEDEEIIDKLEKKKIFPLRKMFRKSHLPQ